MTASTHLIARVLAISLLFVQAGVCHAAPAGSSLPGGSQAKPIRIGFICPLSGPGGDFGNSARIGAELAVAEINEVGGYAGRPFSLLVRDDKADPVVGRQSAEELIINEKVDFSVAFCHSGVAAKALEIYEKNRHVLVIPVATASRLTEVTAPRASFVFRMSVRDDVQAALLVDEIMRKGLRRIAVFADRTGYGEGGLKDVHSLLGQHGLEPVYVARFNPSPPSLLAEMKSAKAAGAQAIVGYMGGADFAITAKARQEAGLSATLYGPLPLSFSTVSELAGKAANGAVMAQTIIPDVLNERRSSFVVRLKKQAAGAKVSSLMAAAQTYDSVHLMLRVLFQTRGETSSEALKQALENLASPYKGVVTVYDSPFSASDHEAFSKNMVWLGVWQDGEIRYLYSDDAKRASYVRRKQH